MSVDGTHRIKEVDMNNPIEITIVRYHDLEKRKTVPRGSTHNAMPLDPHATQQVRAHT